MKAANKTGAENVAVVGAAAETVRAAVQNNTKCDETLCGLVGKIANLTEEVVRAHTCQCAHMPCTQPAPHAHRPTHPHLNTH